MAASACPVIRPPGLAADQVDTLVTSTYAQWLRMPTSRLNQSMIVKALDGTDNAILTYSFATLAVGQTLGFDAGRAFHDAAEAKGAKQPFDTMSIEDLKSLARAAYAQGKDEPAPQANDSAEYTVLGLPVRSPLPVNGWRLIHCGADEVTFRRKSSNATAAASFRNASFPTFVSESEFLTAVASAMEANLPGGFSAHPWQPTIVKATTAPCADIALNADSDALGQSL